MEEPDSHSFFARLTPDSEKWLRESSPALRELFRLAQEQDTLLKTQDEYFQFFKQLDDKEIAIAGNHGLVLKWPQNPGLVMKICLSKDHEPRFEREAWLYHKIQQENQQGQELLALNTCPILKAFRFAGLPVLVLTEVSCIADKNLALMTGRSLFDRLNYALTWLYRFIEIYSPFLDEGILLADRHGSNIGFNEITLPDISGQNLPVGSFQVPVMLDLEPYWLDSPNQPISFSLSLPTWMPVAMELLVRAFFPSPDEGQLETLNLTRRLAMPGGPPDTGIRSRLEELIRELFASELNPDEEWLLEEARQWLPQLLDIPPVFGNGQALLVSEWLEKLRQETERVQEKLRQWQKESDFSLMEDCFPQKTNQTDSGEENHKTSVQENPESRIMERLVSAGAHIMCKECGRTFLNHVSFEKHAIAHKEMKLSECEFCGGAYYALDTHRAIHYGNKQFECNGCGHEFYRKIELQRHQRVHSGEKPYQCKVCKKKFPRSDSLKEHERTHSNRRPYQCKECNRRFKQSNHLRAHERTHSGERPYQCSECLRTFRQQSHLDKHLQIHNEKKYECVECGKAFSRQDTLQNHELTHSDDKNFHCSKCDKTYRQSSSLRKHMKTHEKPYKCSGCRRMFSKEEELQKHEKVHSGSHKCGECGKTFTQKGTLNRHMNTHNGKSSFACAYCNKNFSREDSKDKHQEKKCPKRPPSPGL